MMIKRRKQIEKLVVVALFLLVLGRWRRNWNYAYAALAILLAGLAWKGFAEGLRIAWMKLGEGLGYVFGKVLLTLVFLLMVIPLSVFARLTGRLNIRLRPGGKTYFKERNHLYVKEDFENPW
jgi:hypothetical protein